MYEVRLGKIDLYGVLSVEVSNGRDITVYDSIGGGKFPKAKSRNLNVYNIELELSEFKQYKYKSDFTQAKKIFREFDKLLNKQSPVRLIVYNESRKISQLVLLEKYDTREKYSGVYEVNIKCTEYVETNVRTTNIPTIKRHGKIPTPPPQPVKVKSAFKTSKTLSGSTTSVTPPNDLYPYKFSVDRLFFTNNKTNKEYGNPANVDPSKLTWVKVDEPSKEDVLREYGKEMQDKAKAGQEKWNERQGIVKEKASKTYTDINERVTAKTLDITNFKSFYGIK